MSLKTVRVCDECKRETPERDDYLQITLGRVSVGTAAMLDKHVIEVCSYDCVAAVTSKWCVNNASLHPELDRQ